MARSPHPPTVRVGVSACLLGENVRYDGGNKRDDFLTEVLGPYVEWTPVCPEFELGLGAPREPVQLEKEGREIRLRGVTSRRDLTEAMASWSRGRLETLAAAGLNGYVFKARSPSCALAGAALLGGAPHGEQTAGLFARAFLRRFPYVPVTDETGLADPDGRRHFVERVFAQARLQSLFAAAWRPAGLVDFHAAHKYQLRAHAPAAAGRLGDLVSRAGTLPAAELRPAYEQRFAEAMAAPATRGRHVNVLEHIFGHLRDALDAPSRRCLLDRVEAFARGRAPLAGTLIRFREAAERAGVDYIRRQTYLAPYPDDLLRALGGV